MVIEIFKSVFDTFFGQLSPLELGDGLPLHQKKTDDFLVSLNLSPPPKRKSAPLKHIKETLPKTEKDISSVPGISVIELGTSRTVSELEKKLNIATLRNYAKNSVWVRAAIDYQRRMLGRAKYELVPRDSTRNPRRIDKTVRAAVEELISHPNKADESYGTIKETFIEDYFVIGHGVVELDLNRDLTVRGMRTLDAARIGFIKSWDGTDINTPRFVEFSDKHFSRVKRYLSHSQAMCLVNRPMSDSKLGFSHVEALHKTVIALLSGDELLISRILEPVKEKMISLGEGATKTQVDDFKFQIQQVKDKLAIIGGVKDPKVLDLSASAEEMKILDSCEWFVRQVAAVFDMSTAKLKLSVDTSRANTEAMFDDDIQAIEGDLTRLEELETSVFINRHNYTGEINLKFSYPILHRKDEKEQAQIARLQTGDAGWVSTNEARSRTGEKPLDINDYPFANDPLIKTREGPVPLSILSLKWQKMKEDLENPSSGNGMVETVGDNFEELSDESKNSELKKQ